MTTGQESRVSGETITREIERDPREVERIRRARQHGREGKVYPRSVIEQDAADLDAE